MRTDEILKLVTGPEVLDIGCAGHELRPGKPDWLHGRLREHFRVTGIDISDTNVNLLTNLGFDNVYVQSAETFELGKQYNTIVAGEVLEHLSNPGSFLVQARKHLLPEGRLIVSTPYAFSLMYTLYALDHFPKTCENKQHTSWFCLSTITELSRRVGLQVESCQLIDDYSATVSSRKYQLYWWLVRTVGAILPDKVTKTNMLVVLRRVT
jgi:2-polyprenyl-3-methyl-5-hydroxy-6-metoxy-1,4-benzoquinol methylase